MFYKSVISYFFKYMHQTILKTVIGKNKIISSKFKIIF